MAKKSSAKAAEKTVKSVEETVEKETVENVNEEVAEGTSENVESLEGTVEETEETTENSKKDKRDDEIADLKERLTRNLAEFDNFRKRTDREKAQMFDMGAKTMVEKLLPVIDNLERGLATLDESALEDAFAAGIEKTYKQLQTVLSEAGVTVIESVGKEFNPDFHNAVMHVDDENFGDNTVCEEFQKGYMYRDTVVRHSMVKVAN